VERGAIGLGECDELRGGGLVGGEQGSGEKTCGNSEHENGKRGFLAESANDFRLDVDHG